MARMDLDNVSLRFQVRQYKKMSLKEYLLKQMYRRSANPVMQVDALQNIDLHLKDGDRLGIIGHNGAGKSTILKLLAGVYPPTKGTRRVEGRISSLFDLVLGFEQEASGWENICYRGYLQGETPVSIQSKMKEIAEFSELGDFLDMQVRYYSSGMMVRLAFAIATAIEPEILLVDEVLSVGDMTFQSKARQRMREMTAKASIVVMVTHDVEALPLVCDRALWLDHGCMRQLGPATEVVAAYTQAMQAAQARAA